MAEKDLGGGGGEGISWGDGGGGVKRWDGFCREWPRGKMG